MKLGALLVLIGTILAGVDLALVRFGPGREHTGLLHVAVLLIGVGVLVGHTTLQTD